MVGCEAGFTRRDDHSALSASTSNGSRSPRTALTSQQEGWGFASTAIGASRTGHRAGTEGVQAAHGVDSDQGARERESLEVNARCSSVSTSGQRGGALWTAFLRSLEVPGPAGVKLVIADAPSGWVKRCGRCSSAPASNAAGCSSCAGYLATAPSRPARWPPTGSASSSPSPTRTVREHTCDGRCPPNRRRSCPWMRKRFS